MFKVNKTYEGRIVCNLLCLKYEEISSYIACSEFFWEIDIF